MAETARPRRAAPSASRRTRHRTGRPYRRCRRRRQRRRSARHVVAAGVWVGPPDGDSGRQLRAGMVAQRAGAREIDLRVGRVAHRRHAFGQRRVVGDGGQLGNARRGAARRAARPEPELVAGPRAAAGAARLALGEDLDSARADGPAAAEELDGLFGLETVGGAAVEVGALVGDELDGRPGVRLCRHALAGASGRRRVGFRARGRRAAKTLPSADAVITSAIAAANACRRASRARFIVRAAPRGTRSSGHPRTGMR